MKGPKPKAPKENRVLVEEEIRAMVINMPVQHVLGMLFPFFTTIDLVGIRDQWKKDKESGSDLS